MKTSRQPSRQPSLCAARQAILDYLSVNTTLCSEDIPSLSDSSGVSTNKLIKALKRLSRFKVISLNNQSQYQLGNQSLQNIPEESLYTKLRNNGPLPIAALRDSLRFDKKQMQSSLGVLRTRGLLQRSGSLYSLKSPPTMNPVHIKSSPKELSDLETLISSVKANQTAFDSAKKLADVLRTQANNLLNRANNLEASAKDTLEKSKEALRSKLGNLI
jgi:hypothetical protein